MKKYLANLHQKPDHHKKQFALLASGTITLVIFGIWSLATFGTGTGIIARMSDEDISESAAEVDEVSPFESLSMSLAASLEALKSNFSKIKAGLGDIDLDAEYQEMRDSALDIYGE